MIYKINIDKKQEVIKWNYKQTLKNLLPIIVPGFIIVNIIMLIFFPRKFQNIESLIPIIILGCNLIRNYPLTHLILTKKIVKA